MRKSATWSAWIQRIRLSRKNTILCIVGVALFAIGIAIGMLIPRSLIASQFFSVRSPESEFTLIDPVLYVTVPETASFPLYAPLKSALSSKVNAAISTGKGTQISVYYRDLNSNRWVGINPDTTFWPASMLKVAVLMSTLNTYETNPETLDHKVPITQSDYTDLQQDFFPPANPVKIGQTYSINDLLGKMIDESDNSANNAIISYIGPAAVQKTLSDLYVPLPNLTTGSGISAQQYSHLFRVLYNATYLSPADSNRALELLSKTSFTQGLVAGVPAGTTVAHKFGETTISTPGDGGPTIHELHDCGIVYYPNHPYFLCVMTRGADYSVLAEVIQEISRTTWQQVDTLNKGTKADPQSGFL
jgi:beta-lactamase class A